MNIFLSTTTYDLSGWAAIRALPDSSLGETTRRVNRVATLDGGVVVNDGGFAEGDKTISAIWRPVSKAHDDAVAYLVATYSVLLACTRDGAFLVSPERFVPGRKQNRLSLLVTGKVSA